VSDAWRPTTAEWTDRTRSPAPDPLPPATLPGTRLRLARLSRGLSQQDLARLAGVTRQAIAGIEAGRWDPSLRVAIALAGALDERVEELFAADPPPTPERLRHGGTRDLPPGTRLEVAAVGDEKVAFPLTGAAALRAGFAPSGGVVVSPPPAHRSDPALLRRRVEGRAPATSCGNEGPSGPTEPEGGPPGRRGPEEPGEAWCVLDRPSRPGPTVVVAGCDPALPLLGAALLEQRQRVRLLWWPSSSREALALLAARLVHLAGVHYEVGPGRPRRPGHLETDGTAVVGFASWREGLGLAPGGPSTLAALVESGRPIVNRERGAEARELLGRHLREVGCRPEEVAGWASAVPAHLLVASAVTSGLGAAGITTEPAALVHGLRFLPLAEERFDLVVPRDLLHLPEVATVVEALGSRVLRRQLARLPGYDLSNLGVV
jgi:putative molybdopterin biosynthesis protein